MDSEKEGGRLNLERMVLSHKKPLLLINYRIQSLNF